MDNDLYMVKFESKGKTYFGVVESYSNEAKDYAAQGKCIVADAVLPKNYLVAREKLVSIAFGLWREHDFDDEYHQYVAAEFKKAEAISDALADGIHVGSLFGTHVGDGTAWYVVTAVNQRTCTVEWRGFSMDRYKDRYFGDGGNFPIKRISQFVAGARAIKKIFAS